MKRIQIGLKGPTGYLRADSDAMTNSDANLQLATIADAKEKGPDALIRLPWIVLLAGDVLFARTAGAPGAPPEESPPTASRRVAKKTTARKSSRAGEK